MRSMIFIFGLFALTSGLHAAQQTLTVTPQTLTDWTIVSADPQALASQRELTLPAGAQLARSFSATDVGLEVTTRPVVGPSAADWPELDLGSTSLVFARNGTAGRLVLVSGNNAPLELPFDFALDADGRSTDSLTVTFARQGSVVSVGFSGQTLQFPAEPTADPTIEIVASAGTTQAWSFAKLAVTVGSVDPVTPATGGIALPTGHAGANTAASGTSSRAGASPTNSGLAGLAGMAAPARGQTTAPAAAATGTANRLETFTPPAVRYGRADALRATVLGKNQ